MHSALLCRSSRAVLSVLLAARFQTLCLDGSLQIALHVRLWKEQPQMPMRMLLGGCSPSVSPSPVVAVRSGLSGCATVVSRRGSRSSGVPSLTSAAHS